MYLPKIRKSNTKQLYTIGIQLPTNVFLEDLRLNDFYKNVRIQSPICEYQQAGTSRFE